MKLYHKQLGFPKSVKLTGGLFRLIWSNHAIRAAQSDKYGEIVKVTHISFCPTKVFEIEVCAKGNILKMAYRSHHCEKYDICYVLVPSGNQMLVKTVWLNQKKDNHSTLDSSKYCKPV